MCIYIYIYTHTHIYIYIYYTIMEVGPNSGLLGPNFVMVV